MKFPQHIYRRCKGKWALLVACAFVAMSASATESDTLQTEQATEVVQSASDTTQTKHHSFGHKIADYFRNSNKQKADKKYDFGFIPGPNYSATTGFGLGLLGTLTYSSDRSDKSLPRSNASAYGNFTTGGYFLVGVRGNHIFPHDCYRLDYKLNLSTFSTSFWGIGYTNDDDDNNEASYRRNRINAMARFMFRLAPNTFIGPFLNYRIVQAREVENGFAHLWQGQDHTVRAYTAGVSFTYDSRDFMLNAHKGIFLQIDQTFTPRFLGNGNYCFSGTEITFSTYGKLWKGATLAGELHGQFNYGNTPWTFLAEAGTNDRMRGYYEGRYRDKNLIEGQIELRQHVKGRSGVVGWVALGNVFDTFDHMAWRKTLPNAGVGYRWEFKKRINIRVDYGFTRKGGGFIFNINEAF